jgi:hypothetical protein
MHRSHGSHGRELRNRLSRRHRVWTYVISAAVLLTGVCWLLAHYLLAGDCPFGECRSPLEPWILRAHGAAAFAALVLLGSLLPAHVTRAWQAGRNRFAGAAVIAGIGALVVSGYGLYYVAEEALRPWVSGLHWALGLSLIPLFAAHLYAGRRLARGRAVDALPPRPPGQRDNSLSSAAISAAPALRASDSVRR